MLLQKGFSIPLGNGVSFRLKRKDQLLDYILTLMGRDGTDGFADSDLELLHTQALPLSVCITLVSVEPKLTIETRNRVMKILAKDGEQNGKEKWINLIGDLAGCISTMRPKEVQNICKIFTKSLNH